MTSYLYTAKISTAGFVSVVVFLTLVGGRLAVAERAREYAGAVLHQELRHRKVVAGGSAVERRPAIRVGGVDVTPVRTTMAAVAAF